jgi:hypothetical protein
MSLTVLWKPEITQVTGNWRKLHDEDLHVLYSSANIIEVIK